MTVFDSKEQAVSVFSRLFEILLEDEEFVSRVRVKGLTLHLAQTKPDFELFVEPEGVHVDRTPARAAITIKMSCDTAHALWSGNLLMPIALATGRVRIRGSVSKVLEFVPLLRPAFDRYPELAAGAGVAG